MDSRNRGPAVLETEQQYSPKDQHTPAAAQHERTLHMLTVMGTPTVLASESLQQLMKAVERIARTHSAALITGETGSGKELIARAIHQFSPRAAKPWIDINCAALPGHLLESELFGYDKGAFSGAESAKQGMFELAHGGTLFLDEIGELEFGLQAKLLRILDGASYFRLGGTRKQTVDVRIVAATNVNLQEAVKAGKLRQDLYYRLNQVSLRVPPLRERPDDIAALAQFFLAKQDPRLRFSPEALQVLCSYDWPGNVRELRNVVTTAAIFVEGMEIQPFDLPPELFRKPGLAEAASTIRLAGVEQELVMEAMERTGGRQDRAAEMLGIPAAR